MNEQQEAIPVTSEDVQQIIKELEKTKIEKEKETNEDLSAEEKEAIIKDRLLPYRKEGESFEEYRARKKWADKATKNYLKMGRMFHISSVLGIQSGMGRTYVKPKEDKQNE